MRCDEVLELINRELDGDLTDEEQMTLHDHLHSCSDCMEMYTRLQAVSSQLQSLPMVTPPFNIVDSILPSLGELDNQGEENHSHEQNLFTGPIPLKQGQSSNGKKAWAKKRWWIPSSIVAAGLLAVYISSTTPFGSSPDQSASNEEAMYSNEVALDGAPETSMLAKNPMGDRAESGDRSLADDNGEGDQQMSTFQIPEQDESAATADTEHPALYSPNGKYVVQPGYENEDIRIDLQNGEPYYMTKKKWSKPWEIHSMEWVSNEQFYFVLYNAEVDEYQYWLIHVEERTEEQLEEPYRQHKD